MTARRDVTAMPAALRRLAAALDDVLSLSGLADTRPDSPPMPMPNRRGRRCGWCQRPLPAIMRIDAVFCSVRCRKAHWRARTGATGSPSMNGANTGAGA